VSGPAPAEIPGILRDASQQLRDNAELLRQLAQQNQELEAGWRGICSALGLRLERREDAPQAIRDLVSVASAGQGRLYRHYRNGRLYRQWSHESATQDYAEGDLMSGRGYSGVVAADPIKAGETFVMYRDALSGKFYGRPTARFSDPERLIPLDPTSS